MIGFRVLLFLCLSVSLSPCHFLSQAWAMGRRPETPEAAPPVAPTQPAFSTLRDCYELALKRSETVAIQKEEIKEAEAQFFKAASEAIGDVDFLMDFSRQDNPEGTDTSTTARSFTDPERRERKFVIKQPLFQGFKALGALTGAGSLRREEKEEWLRAKQLLFLDVARAFYGVLRQKKELETIEGIHSLFQERIQELGQREKIGRSRPSEVATAQARMKLLEADRARAAGALVLARYLLQFLIGASLENYELQEEELPQGRSDGLPRYLEAAERRADVEAQRQAVKTAWRNVVIAQSSLWPELSLESNQYQRREGLAQDIEWDVLFKVDVPLSRGGETVGKMKEAVSRWRKSKFSYSLAKRKTELEIQESYQNWVTSLDETQALEAALKASQENFLLQKEEYAKNLVNNLDVLEALESLFETRREANRADYEMKANYWALRIAAGESL